MTATRKFLFETSFDKVEPLPNRPERRAAAPPPVTMTEEELAQIRAECFAQGCAKGAEDARAAAEALATQILGRIEERMKETLAAVDLAKDGIKRDAVQAAVFVTRKIVPGFARNANMAEIEALVASCLAKVLDEPRVVVRVHDSLLDPLKERVVALAERSGFSGRIVLIADDKLSAADCRVEWADGGAERDTEWMWSQIEGVVQRFLSGLSAPG
jgi:flagellar assembly protein FliH